MDPFFFGTSTAPLYGVYHAPQGVRSREHPVVICSPFGQEYMRSHKALRQLANLLTRQGFAVFRFDYRGCGDSGGDPDDFTMQDWIDDVVTAATEARQMLGTAVCSLVGLRLGGTIAALAAPAIQGIQSVVLWDCVIKGADYRRELVDRIAESENRLANFIEADGTIHFNGFPISAHTMEYLEELDFASRYPQAASDVLQVVSTDSPGNRALQHAWRNRPGYSYRYVEAPGDWTGVDVFGGILLPQPVIQTIVAYLTQRGT